MNDEKFDRFLRTLESAETFVAQSRGKRHSRKRDVMRREFWHTAVTLPGLYLIDLNDPLTYLPYTDRVQAVVDAAREQLR